MERDNPGTLNFPRSGSNRELRQLATRQMTEEQDGGDRHAREARIERQTSERSAAEVKESVKGSVEYVLSVVC